jgi:molecular chaperone DnaK (HSP70)
VTALEKTTNVRNEIIISNDQGRLDKSDIETMIREARQYADEDQTRRLRTESKNVLESLCYFCKQTMENQTVFISDKDRMMILAMVDDIMTWMTENQYATKSIYDSKTELLRIAFDDIRSATTTQEKL